MFFLQILAGLAALLGLLFLPAVWGVLLFLIWAVQVISTGVLSLCRPDSGKFGGGAQRVSPSVLPKSSAVFGIAGSSGTVGIGTA